MNKLILALMLCSFAWSASAFPLTVNNCSRTLTFKKAPERVVVHDINMSEMAFALGLQDRIVGVTGISGWYKTSKSFNERRGDIPDPCSLLR